jgi:tripartite ATP-independent transporter DctM subunit
MVRPHWVPALPLEARSLREETGKSGIISVAVLVALSAAIAVAYAKLYLKASPLDETIVIATCVGTGVAFLAAVINHFLKLGLLSKIAERATFVMIPPLALIFLVLGTIFLGVATPTEGGAMGATGALIMALARRRLTWRLLRQAMDTTAKLSTFVVFILIGARVFSLTFYGVNGHVWVEHLLTSLPGGQLGFLIVVNILIFVLAFFLDFFELSFIVVPLVGPVAEKLGIDLIWFGVLLGVNMQTSFMHPPFGFALFYLRSVAPAKEYTDKLTRKRMAPVTTGQIYWGAVPFVLIQVVMIALVILFPQMVMVYKAGESTVDPTKIQIQLPPSESGSPSTTEPGQPQTQQQLQQEDKEQNKDAQSLEDLFKGSAPVTPSPEKAPSPSGAAPPSK